LSFKTNCFQIIFRHVTYSACDSSAWNTTKTPFHFIWDNFSGLKIITKKGLNGPPVK